MKPPRKVVHLTSVHSPDDTRIFRKECRTLAHAGYDVVLVVPDQCDEVRDGVQFRAVRHEGGRMKRMTRTAAAVVRRAMREQADLYHFHDPELLPWARILHLRGELVVFDMHENTPAAIHSRPWVPHVTRGVAALAYRMAERRLLADIPVIFAEHSYARLYPWIAEHTTVLNLPVIADLPRPSLPRSAAPTLVYIGAISSDRGSSVSVAAIEMLRREGRDVRWECIGPVPHEEDKAQLSAAAARLGRDVIRLRGRMPQEEAFRIAGECHIGLAILQKVPNYTDSYPTKLFEYMGLGLPVVTSDFPLYRQIVEEVGCGFCVDPRDPAAIATALRRLLDDADQATAMGERGRRAACERYNWTTEGRKLLSFYGQLLNAGEPWTEAAGSHDRQEDTIGEHDAPPCA